jgi:hypothetical protein
MFWTKWQASIPRSIGVRVTLRLAVYLQTVHLGDKPLETHDQHFFQLNICGLTSSLKRGWVCRLQSLVVLASPVILGYKSRATHDHILLSQIPDSPNLEGQFPVFISPSDRVAQLYPPALSSLFVLSYDSQGYGGGILTRLHTESTVGFLNQSIFCLRV